MNWPLSKSKMFLFCLIAFILGIGMASFVPKRILNFDIYYFVIALTFASIVIFFWKNYKTKFIALLGLFLFLGIWRYAINTEKNTPDKIWYYNNETVKIVGKIIKEPDRRSDYQKLEIAVDNISKTRLKISGHVLVTTNLYPIYNYGDKLELECKLQSPEKIENFNYDRYLARYDIYSLCYFPAIKKVGENSGNIFFARIYDFKNFIRDEINFGLSEPSASLAMGILLGDTKGTTAEIKDAFSRTGLSHLTAVSGMNISIIATLLMPALLFVGLWRRQAFHVTIIFLIIFIILVGMPASAVRAGIMGFLALLAVNSGRANRITNAVALTAAATLMFNPKLLRDDIGWQLSFLAVLGIMYIYPWLNNFFDKIKLPTGYGLRDGLSITLSAQVFTLPIIGYNFSIISLSAPLANILVLWSITFLTVALFVAVILSWLIPAGSIVFFLPAGLLIKYLITVALTISSWHFSYLQIDYFPVAWLIVYYAVVLFLLVLKNKKSFLFS